MSLTDTFQLGNILCRFDHFEAGGLENVWTWQLDSYKVISGMSQPVQLTVKNSMATSPEQDRLVYEETTGFFSRRVFKNLNGETDWIYLRKKNENVYLQYRVSPQWDQISLVKDSTNTAGALAFIYLGLIIPSCVLKHNLLTFHSALVEYQGQAFAVCAPSGTGKTTHARLWRDSKNALILNGDRAVMGKSGAGWTAYGTPWSGTSGEQINRHAPLKALVVLERAPQNSVERLQGLSAFGSVLPHLLYPAWDKPLAVTAIDGLNDLLETVPVYRLRCRPDAGAVDVLCRALYEG